MRMGVPNPTRFRGHSFRRGGAIWAFQNGVPGYLIQIYGDWASDTYKCYLEFSNEAKLQVAREMVNALPPVLDSQVGRTTAFPFVWRFWRSRGLSVE